MQVCLKIVLTVFGALFPGQELKVERQGWVPEARVNGIEYWVLGYMSHTGAYIVLEQSRSDCRGELLHKT